MPTKSWGTPLKINEYILVGNSDEIPKGQKAYVFGYNSQTVSNIDEARWNKVLNGNLSEMQAKIESQIKGSRVVYCAVSWEKAVQRRIGSVQQGTERYVYDVTGFKVEAIVENVSASLTGLEIVAIIMAVSFLIAVVAILFVTGWVTWRVISATEQIGPAATVGAGLALIVLLIVALLLLFGVKGEYKGKKRRFKIGK